MGSMAGGLLILFFAVIYSHQIFFSDRWDPTLSKYPELWFFTMSIAVLVPVILRTFRGTVLAWFTRICLGAIPVLLGIWIAVSWPSSTTEAAYTSIGYAFRENVILLQFTLHLAATVLSSIVLQQVIVPRDQKPAAFKTLGAILLGALALGAGMLGILSWLGYPGLHVIFIFSIIWTGGLAIFSRWNIGTPQSIITPADKERDSILKNAGRKRELVFPVLIIGVSLVVALLVPKKNWETIILVALFAVPLLEVTAALLHFAKTRKHREVRTLKAYGEVGRAWLAFFFCLFGFLLALLLAGYYRYLVPTMMVLSASIALGFNLASARFRGKKGQSTFSSPRELVVFLTGMLMLAITGFVGYSQWMAWAESLEGLNTSVQDSQGLPFLGLLGMIPAGFAIGLVMWYGFQSFQKYHLKTYLTAKGEPAWNGISTTWCLLLIPGAFYFGQVFFDNRIFEWGDLLLENVTKVASNVFIVVVILLVFAMLIAGVGILKWRGFKHFPKYSPAMQVSEDRDARHARVKSLAILGLLVVSSFGFATVTTVWPRQEPSYRALLATDDDLLLWSTYPAEKVTDSYVPGSFVTTATEINVTMAAGETERVHLILTPRAPLRNLSVAMSPLLLPISHEAFPASGINWYYATYNFDGQEEHLVPGNASQYRGRENVTSTYLAQIASWPVESGKNQPLWLSFTSLYNTTAGSYEGNVTVSWVRGDIPSSILLPVRVVVVDYQKPLKHRVGTLIGLSLGNAAQRGRSLWRHGRMGYNPPYPEMLPTTFVETIDWGAGTFTLNFTAFNVALNACAQAGYTHQIWSNFTNTVLAVQNPAPFSARWNQTVLAILGNMTQNLTATTFDLPFGQGQIRAIDLIYADIYDEPGSEDAWRFRFGQLLDQAAPDWRLLCTTGITRASASWPGYLGPGGVFDVIDVRIQGPLGFQDYFDDPYIRQLYAEYPAENWIYWINSPWPPYPNSAQAYNPGSAIFSQVIQYYVLTNVSGFLFWTSGDETWADGGNGYAGWGSGQYFYPAGDNSGDWDPCYRFELLDDGMEVAELVRHLDALIANGTTGPLNTITLPQAINLRTRFNQMFPHFKAYPKPSELGFLYSLRLDLLAFLAIVA